MSGEDPLETQREIAPAVVAELSAAGFEEAHEIGRGGFGVVYRCVQSSLDRVVAVKVLTADLDEENRARFFREQQAMGRLTGHPNIVNVLHVGTTDSGHPYIVMQYHPRDSLDARIREHGPLALNEALRLGVRMAGALETAHRLGILHRDVKPGNILLTEYGEPALTDFGIAHIAGGFETSTGTVTGSPAFTAPEVLSGEAPSIASDIYSLGATVCCALTGHAAFERRSGEHVVAQFLRITTQPVPDLRAEGIDEDLSSVVEQAMSADPRERPATAVIFGEQLREIQLRNGFPADRMALRTGPKVVRNGRGSVCTPSRSTTAADRRNATPTPVVRVVPGTLPLELTSFVNRRRELTRARRLLSRSRLVTLTGIGGVGKTRLALRVAADVRKTFADGLFLVELGELRDASSLDDVVAAALGLRDQSMRATREMVVHFLLGRHVLLVLDNCEQLVDSVADLAETLLRACPRLRILATSREPLGIGGEVVLRVPPLTVPEPDDRPTLEGLPRYDAVTLFAERAAAAVPGFEVTEDNRATVTRICQQLDGLPLPIELAAARLRAMSADQILHRLTDRYTLLTFANRGAPSRQQTLRLSIDWSYELCTDQEQRLWAELSVFAGSFELDAAEGVCSEEFDPDGLLDMIASLVDKSILIREEAGSVVRFRLFDTLREYGREKAEDRGDYLALQRRHRDWYRQLVFEAEDEWIGPQQLRWISRLSREQPNLREAIQFCLDEDETEAGLQIAATLYPFWVARGLLGEGWRWLDRLLAGQGGQPTVERIKGLFAASMLAGLLGDLPVGTALVEEGKALIDRIGDVVHGHIAFSEGFLALFGGEPARAGRCFEAALEAGAPGEMIMRLGALVGLGLSRAMLGEIGQAIDCYEQVLAITELQGETVNRSYALWSMGVAVWRQGDSARAKRLLEECLRLTRLADNPVIAANSLEVLAWITGEEHNARRAVVLMTAAEVVGRSVGSMTVLYPSLRVFHEDCQRATLDTLGTKAFEAAADKARVMSFDDAVSYALDEQTPAVPAKARVATNLTKRERQVADLIAQGLTNKAIAAELVISQRTAQGHVEHILAKLGFASRAQIAAWVVEEGRDEHPS